MYRHYIKLNPVYIKNRLTHWSFSPNRNGLCNAKTPWDCAGLKLLESDIKINGLTMEISCELVNYILEAWGNALLIVPIYLCCTSLAHGFCFSQEDDCMAVLALWLLGFKKSLPLNESQYALTSQLYLASKLFTPRLTFLSHFLFFLRHNQWTTG